jgi:hypothetical protein
MPSRQRYANESLWPLTEIQVLFMCRLRPNSGKKTPKKKLPTEVESIKEPEN